MKSELTITQAELLKEQLDARCFKSERDTAQADCTGMREALKLAKSNIEHMAAFLSSKFLGYSFESLGEDMPTIDNALSSTAGKELLAAMALKDSTIKDLVLKVTNLEKQIELITPSASELVKDGKRQSMTCCDQCQAPIIGQVYTGGHGEDYCPGCAGVQWRVHRRYDCPCGFVGAPRNIRQHRIGCKSWSINARKAQSPEVKK